MSIWDATYRWDFSKSELVNYVSHILKKKKIKLCSLFNIQMVWLLKKINMFTFLDEIGIVELEFQMQLILFLGFGEFSYFT